MFIGKTAQINQFLEEVCLIYELLEKNKKTNLFFFPPLVLAAVHGWSACRSGVKHFGWPNQRGD